MGRSEEERYQPCGGAPVSKKWNRPNAMPTKSTAAVDMANSPGANPPTTNASRTRSTSGVLDDDGEDVDRSCVATASPPANNDTNSPDISGVMSTSDSLGSA